MVIQTASRSQCIFLVDSPCAEADACDAGMTCATVPAGHVCLCADGAADCTDQEGRIDLLEEGRVGWRVLEKSRKRGERGGRRRVDTG